jgi:hypothetical protein
VDLLEAKEFEAAQVLVMRVPEQHRYPLQHKLDVAKASATGSFSRSLALSLSRSLSLLSALTHHTCTPPEAELKVLLQQETVDVKAAQELVDSAPEGRAKVRLQRVLDEAKEQNAGVCGVEFVCLCRQVIALRVGGGVGSVWGEASVCA